MELRINLNNRDIITVRGCCSYNYMSNTNVIMLHFDKEIDRAITKSDMKRSALAPKITEFDNSEYLDLPECYKLFVSFDYPIQLMG